MRKGGVPPNLTDERKILEKIISERQEGNFTANRAEDDKREAERQLLRICHLSADLKELIGHLIVFFKKLTDCQAVGIRLRQKEDFPYYESCGFAPHFIQKENYLCQRTPEGDIVLDSAGTPVLECMCGNVLRGRFDSSLPFFTERGSFWTNSTTELLAATSEADRQARTRSRCNGEGYESLALIPFRLNENVFGLLQLNDKTPGRFTPELISGLEDLAAYVSLSLSKHLSDIFRRESEERLQQALLVSRSYTFEWKPSPDQILRSDSCATILHLSGDEVRHDTGQRYFQKVHPDDRARLVQILHDLTPTASTYATEYRFVCSDNTIVVLEEVGQAAFDAAGKMERVVGVTTDVTERKQVEEQLEALNEELERRVERRTRELQESQAHLLHAEKLSAIGRLSASIAHEFNNPLQGVMTVLKGFQKTLVLEKQERVLLDLAFSECERMKYLVRSLQDFNRPSASKKVLMDVHAMIDALILLSKSDLKRRRISTILNYDKNLPQIQAICDQIKQVILNLLQNAADACEGRNGVITITTYRENQKIAVAIQDTGAGIPSENFTQIFQPFFTTKPEIKGTGLGLSICHGIIKNHQGEIRVESEPGKGSTFTVLLPIVGESS